MKKCSKCKRELDKTSFCKNCSKKDGLNCTCRECVSKKDRKRYETNKELIKAKTSEYYKKNTARCNARSRLRHANNKSKYNTRSRKYYKEHREELKDKYMQKKYGISVDQFSKILISQDGKCAICKVDLTNSKQCIDHNHTTGHIRAVLCGFCNSMLGYARESESTLRAAIEYLSDWKERERRHGRKEQSPDSNRRTLEGNSGGTQ